MDHVFDQARADGTWTVPLQLTIPLTRTDDTAVRGAVDFNGGSVSPIAGLPAFTHVTGSLHFPTRAWMHRACRRSSWAARFRSPRAPMAPACN